MHLEDIRQRCFIDEDTGCWTWRGAKDDKKYPRVWAPNHTKPGSPMETQTGRRAVWHLSTGKPIPHGHRVYGTCSNPLCLNPAHMRCDPGPEWGAHMSKSGVHKTIRRTISARTIGRKRSILTDAIYAEIIASPESGLALSRRLGISRQTISRARRGKMSAFQSVGAPLSALIR